jgi:hypothetical protein
MLSNDPSGPNDQCSPVFDPNGLKFGSRFITMFVRGCFYFLTQRHHSEK